MEPLQLTEDERYEIVNALRNKSAGDREAADTVASDPKEAPGVRELAKTLIHQAERQEALADRIEDAP